METHRIVCVGAGGDVRDRTNADLVYGRVLAGRAASMLGIVDDIRNAVDESNHGVFPIPHVVAKPQAEDA